LVFCEKAAALSLAGYGGFCFGRTKEVHEMSIKVNDVFTDTAGRLWHIAEIQDETATLVDPYGLKGDRNMLVEFVPELFSFCWNAVEEGWAGA